tara:strand:+ start:394 stop:570 length:177 start_codon:yes stop_codon:yes gene_type:complete
MSFASNVIKKEIDNIDKTKNQKTEPKIETSSQKVLEEFRQTKEPWMFDDRNFAQFGHK